MKVTMVKISEEKPEELDVEKSEDKPIKLGANKSEEKTAKIDVEINLLQAAVIKWDIEQVKTITTLAINEGGQTDLDAILKQEMKYNVSNEWEEWDLSPKCSRISDATEIHLATCWHVESLIHLLDVSPLYATT